MFTYTLLAFSISLALGASQCPPGKKTDDPQGRCCVFPFTYRGKSYSACTKYGHNRLWCSLDAVYKGHWANCVNPCTNNPCMNGGTCQVTGDDSYSCQCPEGYIGDNCEKRIPCPPDKRTDDAQGRCCVFPFKYGLKSFTACTKYGHNRLWCSLDAFYRGRWANCVNPCTNNPCMNGGTCQVTGNDSYSCQCPEGYIGDNCEKRLPCPPGKRTDDAQGRCCVFPFKYGLKSFSTCTKHGHNRLWCSLDAFYRGRWANCVNDCVPSPCKNGATCTETKEGYSCQPCPPGWQGKDCDEDVDECESSPCKNGGTCVNEPGTYTCICKTGFRGKLCEEVYWKPEGCFNEKKLTKRLLKKWFKQAKGVTDIGQIFQTCKAAAEQAGYEIFAIRNINNCVTSSNGKLVDFKAYGVSSNCRTNEEGHGIGNSKLAIFVYTR
uniref:Euphy n=1 Tax=Fimbriaphyllia ancora TaxID=46750 RepID=A0A0K0QVE5_FIMAN|nr:euphy [Fimbriaphyllia ancora]